MQHFWRVIQQTQRLCKHTVFYKNNITYTNKKFKIGNEKCLKIGTDLFKK